MFATDTHMLIHVFMNASSNIC